jgi:hypothetical protein
VSVVSTDNTESVYSAEHSVDQHIGESSQSGDESSLSSATSQEESTEDNQSVTKEGLSLSLTTSSCRCAAKSKGGHSGVYSETQERGKLLGPDCDA